MTRWCSCWWTRAGSGRRRSPRIPSATGCCKPSAATRPRGRRAQAPGWQKTTCCCSARTASGGRSPSASCCTASSPTRSARRFPISWRSPKRGPETSAIISPSWRWPGARTRSPPPMPRRPSRNANPRPTCRTSPLPTSISCACPTRTSKERSPRSRPRCARTRRDKVKLVLASNNPGKLREIGALLAPLSIELISQAQLGIGEADEPHATFLENALAKARHASRAAGLPALGDDSGLCVEALAGEPGVHSACYAGREGSREERDARNNEKILSNVKQDRKAYYCCLMVLLRHPDDPQQDHQAAKISLLLLPDGPAAASRRPAPARRRRRLERRDRPRPARQERLRLRPAVPAAGARADGGGARSRAEEPHQPPRTGAGQAVGAVE